MSDYAHESPPEVPALCPTCHPKADFEATVVAWCGAHAPDLAGLDDAIATPIVGTSYFGGATGRRRQQRGVLRSLPSRV